MTLAMADSITPANLPHGYDAYLGYIDGRWPTARTLGAMFPAKHVVTLTVLGGQAVADGCDCEPGDLSPALAVAWTVHRLAAGAWRPVIYASASAMADMLMGLAAAGVPRSAVRLLSAHYGAGEHICGPGTCGLVHVPMDGTQWTDTAPGLNGTSIDASVLADDFFGAAPAAAITWQEDMMRQLPTLQQGATGADVRTIQGLLRARGYSISLDGVFGPATGAVVKRLQGYAHLAADGIVGPATWPALMGVA